MYPTLGRIHAFAIAIMVDIACRAADSPAASDELRQRVRLSTSYFDKIVARLRRHELIRTTRGNGGGNVLGRAATLISMRDIVGALEEPLAGAARPRSRCPAADRAAARLAIDLWDAVEARQLEWLGSVTLDSLVQDWLRHDIRPASQPVPPAAHRTHGIVASVSQAPNSVFSLAATLTAKSLWAQAPERPDRRRIDVDQVTSTPC